MGEILIPLMRWLHLASMTALIGGILYARFVIAPSESSLPADARTTLDDRAARYFRPVVYGAIVLLVVSGLFNYMTKPGRSSLFHILFGIKILLALHVFGVSILIAQPGNKRRNRQLFGAAVSGLIILLIASYLKGIN
jgi:uncharacterized membrane protein